MVDFSSKLKRRKPWEGSQFPPRRWQCEAISNWLVTTCEGPIIRAVTGAGKSVVIAEAAFLTEADLLDETGVVVVTTPTVKLVEQLAATLKKRGCDVGMFYTKSKSTNNRVIVVCNDSLSTLALLIGPPKLLIIDECHKSENPQMLDVINGDGFNDPWEADSILGFTATPYRSDDKETLSLFTKMIYNYGWAEAISDKVVVRPIPHQYIGDGNTSIDDACIEMIQTVINNGPGLVDSKNITDAIAFSEKLNAVGIRCKVVHSKLFDITVKNRLKDLESGKLQCLVHVSMLSEGVDLPWLRWICCRRQIRTKVLFAQYVGRGLRKNGAFQWGDLMIPEKTHCDILDPSDLFGVLALDYEPQLSTGEEVPEDPALALDFVVQQLKKSDSPSETLEGVPIVAMEAATSYVRQTNMKFQCMGFIPMVMKSFEWRTNGMTPLQWDKINKMIWVIAEPEVPEKENLALKICYKTAHIFDCGTASDFIAILTVLERGWPEEESVTEVTK